MSESAKSASDIDDVLSSIRRLVSESPPSSDTAAAGPFVRPRSADGSAERLVLTPALRVTDASSGPEESDDAGPSSDGVSDAEHEFAESPDTDDSKASDAGPAQRLSDADADTPEAAPSDRVDQTDATDLHGAETAPDGSAAEPDQAATDDIVADIASLTSFDADTEDGVSQDAVAERKDDGADPVADPANLVHMDDSGVAAAEEPEDLGGDAVSAEAQDTLEGAPEDAAATAVEASAVGGDAAPQGDDANAADRAVGSDGWRPEVRLFDLDATEQVAQTDSSDELTGAFEPDSDDVTVEEVEPAQQVSHADTIDGLHEAAPSNRVDQTDATDLHGAETAPDGPAAEPDRAATDDIIADIASLTSFAANTEDGVSQDAVAERKDDGADPVAASANMVHTGDSVFAAANEPEDLGGDAVSAKAQDTLEGAPEDAAATAVEAGAVGGDAAPQGDDTNAADRAVGSDGWRPEMRLFDWDATGQVAETETSGELTGEFEPDTGDANWPDTQSNRALLDLAAARGAATQDGTRGAVATPVFARSTSALPARTVQNVEDGEPAPENATEGTSSDGVPGAAAPPSLPEEEAFDNMPPPVVEPDYELEREIAGSDAATVMSQAEAQALEEVVTQRTASRVSVLMGNPREVSGDETDEAGDSATPDDAGAHTPALSELENEALRRIVADVVREELRGALGQRITRNVRKLVRREIRLLLAADELD